jgi:hypothetical protein
LARVNWDQVNEAAKVVAGLPTDIKPLNFYSYPTEIGEVIASDMYPPRNGPHAIDAFFFEALHEHGFWFENMRGYVGPLYGTLKGKPYKGSDLLWRVVMRKYKKDPEWFTPKKLFLETEESLRESFFVDDNGTIPFPDLDDRIRRTNEYARWFLSRKMTPSEIVTTANSHSKSLMTFLHLMKRVHGYHEDRFEKRQLLLAMALHNRPEQFLEVNDPERWWPIVDYHAMRVCLRSGMVELFPDEVEANQNRAWVTEETERKIRAHCSGALRILQEQSGRTHAVNDHAIWQARSFCPEMSEPKCDMCHFKWFCARRTELFQPIFRTTAY